MNWRVKTTKVCKNLNYTEHLLISACVVLGFVSISAFSSLIGIPAGIPSPAVWIKVFAITTVIRKYIWPNN